MSTSTTHEVRFPTDVLPPITPQRRRTGVVVELRKMVDTRSGKVLLCAIVGLAAIVLAWKLTHLDDVRPDFTGFNRGTTVAVAFILPLIALLAMTSEWSQRTALTTFTLSPRRLRVFGAKFAAAIALSSAVLAVTLAMTFAATALSGIVGDAPPAWEHLGAELRLTIVTTLAQVVMAAAFGALIPVSAAAVGVFLAAPTVWSAAGPEVLGRNAEWLDVYATYARLGSAEPGADLARTITSITVWVVLPMVLGLHRSLRREAT